MNLAIGPIKEDIMGKTLSRYDEIQIEKAIDILENIVGFHNKNLTQNNSTP